MLRPGRVRPSQVVAPMACGAAAVIAMAAAAALALHGLGVRTAGADGASAVAVVVGAAAGGAVRGVVDVSVVTPLGPLPFALRGEGRAVPVLVTAMGLLVLAATFRALLRRRPAPGLPALAVQVVTAAVTTAALAALLARCGRARAVVSPGADLFGAGSPGAGSPGAGSPGAGLPGAGPRLAQVRLEVAADVVSTGAGALVLALLTLLAVAAAHRRGAPWRGRRPTGRLFTAVVGSVLAAAGLLLVAWSLGRPGLVRPATLLGAPNLMLLGLSRAAGVPWELHPGLRVPVAVFQDPVVGLRIGLAGLVAVVAVARGLVLRRSADPGDTDGGSRGPGPGGVVGVGSVVGVVVRGGLVGAVVLAGVTRLAGLDVTVTPPFGSGPSPVLGAGGDLLVAAGLGLLWGSAAGLLATAVASLGGTGRARPGRILGRSGRVPADRSPVGRAGAGHGIGSGE